MPADVNDGGFGQAAYYHYRHHLDEYSDNFDTCPHSICTAARAATSGVNEGGDATCTPPKNTAEPAGSGSPMGHSTPAASQRGASLEEGPRISQNTRVKVTGPRGACIYPGCKDDARRIYPVCYNHRQEIHSVPEESGLRAALEFIAAVEGPLLESTAYMMRDHARRALAQDAPADETPQPARITDHPYKECSHLNCCQWDKRRDEVCGQPRDRHER